MSDLSNLRDFYLECDSAMGDIELNLGICLDLGKSRLCFFLLFLLLLLLLLFVCLFYVLFVCFFVCDVLFFNVRLAANFLIDKS